MFSGKLIKLYKPVMAASLLAMLVACGGEERKEEHRSKAEAFFQQGDYEKARLEYKNVVLIDPKDVDGHFQLAKVQEELGDFRTAVGEYQNVLLLDEGNVEAKVALGFLYAMGGADLGEELAEQVLSEDADNVDALVIRGISRAKAGDRDAALADGTKAVSLDPENLRAGIFLSNMYLQNGLLDDAEQAVLPLLRKYPEDIDVRNQLGRVYWKQEKYAETIEQLEMTVKLEPEKFEQYVFLSGLQEQTGQGAAAEQTLRTAIEVLPESVVAKMTLADFILKKHGPDAAEKQLQEFLKENNDGEIKHSLAHLYQQSGQEDKAVMIYEEIIAENEDVPSVLDAKNKLAAYHVRHKRIDEANTLLTEILEESPKNEDALLSRGRLALTNKDYQNAINDFRAVLKQNPESIELRRVLARAQLAAGNNELAQANLLKAVEVAPDMPEVKIELSKVSALMGQKIVARDWLNKVLADDPTHEEATRLLVALQIEDKDETGAMRTLKKIQEKAPESAYGHYLEARLHQAKKNLDSSNSSLEKALEKQPGAIEPLVALVSNHLSAKDVDAAYRVIDRALEKNPKHVIALNLKGEIDLASSKLAEAKLAFERARQIKPDWWIPYRNLATVHKAEGNVGNAIEVLSNAIAPTKGSPAIRSELALLYAQSGQRSAAAENYRAVLADQPQNLVVINNLAMLLVDDQASEADLKAAKELVVNLPEHNPALLDTKAWVSFRAGDAVAAEELMKKGLDSNPLSPDLNYHYALMQEAKGNASEAIKHLKVAVENGKEGFVDLEAAKSKLNSLGG